MRRWYWKLRKSLGRWLPDPVQGVSLSPDEPMSCGELPILLDVEGRTGTVYLSRPMWLAVGAKAGWVTEAEALAAWEEEVGSER